MANKKYKIKRLKSFPAHCKNCCYAITEYGHIMLPEDVVRKLNNLETLLKRRNKKETPFHGEK